MPSTYAIVTDYSWRAGTGIEKPEPGLANAWHRYKASGRSGSCVTRVFAEENSLYSFGLHFEMARIMPADDGTPRGWWLVNSDTYSPTTSRQQSEVRAALSRTELPMILLPFSALEQAGIHSDTIQPVEVLPDRYEWTRHHGRADGMPRYRADGTPRHQTAAEVERTVYHEDGTVTWYTQDHVMGESVFTAMTSYWQDGVQVRKRASFLSSFDRQETRERGYFLCQLPGYPVTVAAAVESLRPAEVAQAARCGLEVHRQGDVFAIGAPGVLTRDLLGPSARMGRLLGTSHVATEVRAGNAVYARGTMYHKPERRWQRPQHAARKLGDGKTWHLIIRNTVPPGRSWQVTGGVD